MKMEYTAIVPSRSFENLKFSVGYLIDHSKWCSEILIYWNNEPDTTIDEVISYFKQLQLRAIPKVEVIQAYGMEVYSMYNAGVSASKNNFCLLFNDDMYFPLDWDSGIETLVLEPFQPEKCVITFSLIESGYVDVNEKNVLKDFGQTISAFDKAGFDEYQSRADHVIGNGLGWYMPVIFSKKLFLDQGGYPTNPPFPHPNDIIFFNKLQQQFVHFYKVNSAIYHFQRLSQRPIGFDKNGVVLKFDKLNLCSGDDYREGFINVDVNGKYDLRIDISNGVLPFADKSFSVILFKDAIEHFRFEIAVKLMAEIKRILKPDGVVEIITPELKIACEDYLLGYNQNPSCDPIMRLYGQNYNMEQVHKFVYTAQLDRPNNLLKLLKEWGFAKIETFAPRDADEFGVRAYV